MTDEGTIIALEKTWADAFQAGDASLLDRLVMPDYRVTIAVTGQPLRSIQREAWLAGLSDYRVERYTIDHMQVQVLGTVAVVGLIWTQTASVRGLDRSGTFMITDVWAKDGEDWRMVERYSSRPEPADAHRPL